MKSMSISEKFNLLSEENKSTVKQVVAVLVDYQNGRLTTQEALVALSTLPAEAKGFIFGYLESEDT